MATASPDDGDGRVPGPAVSATGLCYDGVALGNSLTFTGRADSSAGRAQPLQGWGRRFDPCSAYQFFPAGYVASGSTRMR